jgi:hypothetical protein
MNVNFLEFDAGWLWFILAAYGLTQILVYGSIFDQIRPEILGWSPFIYSKRLYRTIYI